jgi:hypothetical protein
MTHDQPVAGDAQTYDQMYRLTRKQFELSRDLHTLADSQLRMVNGMGAHPGAIGKAVAGIAIQIKQVTDQLCELREQMRALYPDEEIK